MRVGADCGADCSSSRSAAGRAGKTSPLTARETRHNQREIETGISPLTYLTPERLRTDECIELLKGRGVSRIVIDEAHCVSEWGHDFRPAYLAIGEAARRLGNPPILALTATATEATVRDIVENLRMRGPRIVRPGLARPNLSFRVRRTVNDDARRSALLDILAKEAGVGIVYVATVKLADEVFAWLSAEGVKVGRYRAELSRHVVDEQSQQQRRELDCSSRSGPGPFTANRQRADLVPPATAPTATTVGPPKPPSACGLPPSGSPGARGRSPMKRWMMTASLLPLSLPLLSG